MLERLEDAFKVFGLDSYARVSHSTLQTEQLEDTRLKLDEVSDIVFVENNDATYKWTAKVKLSARMGSSVSDVMAYNLSYDNANDEFSFEISDGDHDKLMELAGKSAE